jgi:SAM-dependent methyltransferase
VTGVDLTPRHVELARSHLAALGLPGDVAEGDAEGLPFPDDHFDIVVSNGVLHHTPNIDAALEEIWRVLRPGGSVRVVLYNRRSAHFWLWHWLWLGKLHGQLRNGGMDDVLSANVERTSIGARPLVRVYAPRETRELLEAAGFVGVRTIVRQFRWRDVPFGRRIERWAPRTSGRWFGWYVTGYGTKPW